MDVLLIFSSFLTSFIMEFKFPCSAYEAQTLITSGKVAATRVTIWSDLLSIIVIHHNPSGFSRSQNGA